MFEDEEDCAPISTADAVREWASVVGAERPDTQWLLSDYDTWERNPHYAGPAQRHPESYQDEPSEEELAEQCNAAVDQHLDMIELAEQADYEASLIDREEYSWPDYTRGDRVL